MRDKPTERQRRCAAVAHRVRSYNGHKKSVTPVIGDELFYCAREFSTAVVGVAWVMLWTSLVATFGDKHLHHRDDVLTRATQLSTAAVDAARTKLWKSTATIWCDNALLRCGELLPIAPAVLSTADVDACGKSLWIGVLST